MEHYQTTNKGKNIRPATQERRALTIDSVRYLLSRMSQTRRKHAPELEILVQATASPTESKGAFRAAAEVGRVLASFTASELRACRVADESFMTLDELQTLLRAFIPRAKWAADGKRSWPPYKVWAAYDAIAFLLVHLILLEQPSLAVGVHVMMGLPGAPHKLSALARSMVGVA